MARTKGSVGKKTLDYVQSYDVLSLKYTNPLEVLFKLLSSRKQNIRLQAAKELVSYRYPKQAVAHLELEAQGQLVLAWEESIDIKPRELLDLNNIKDITPHVDT